MTRTKPASRKSPPAPSPDRPGFRLDLRVIAIVLAVITLAFFHEVALEGLTFVSPDANAPAGFVRIGETALRHGTYPLWNPYVFLGMPSFASGAYNPYIYPPDWPLALVGKVVPLPDVSWMLIYYFLGGLFTALLAMELGARAEGGLLAGALFAFIPNLVAVGAHGHGSQMVDSAYLPLLVWLAARWMRRGGLHHLGWLALAGGFQMLRGHAQIAFYTWMAVGLYVLVEVIASWRPRATDAPRRSQVLLRGGAVLVAMGLAFGLAGFYNLPLKDYARYSIRGGGADGGVGKAYATSWSMGTWELGTLFLPNAVGFGGQTYFGGMPFTDYPNAFVGIVALVLLLPAFLKRSAARVFALVLAAVALMVSLGHNFPLYGLLYDHLPLFNKFRIPVMIILLFHLAACLGVAWGWSEVLAERDTTTRGGWSAGPLNRLLLVAGAGLVVLFVVGVLGQGGFRDAFARTAAAYRPGYPPELAAQVYTAYVSDIGRAVLLGLLAIAAALLTRGRKLTVALGTLVALGLLLGDILPVSDQVMRPTIGRRDLNSFDAGHDDVIDFLQKQTGLFRVLPLAEFQSNRFSGFGIQSLGGYHAAKPRLVQDLIDRQFQQSMPWLMLLNTRYIVHTQKIDVPGMPLVFQGQGGFVYQNPYAMPRATVVSQVRVAAMDTTVIDSIGRGTRDPRDWVWLEHDPGALGPTTGAKVTVSAYELNDVHVDVETPGRAVLRLADLWYPDWVATLDGRETPILRADYALRAVVVPAGSHRVEFHFRSRAVRVGLMTSLVSLTIALLLIVAGWLRRPSRPDAPRVAEAA